MDMDQIYEKYDFITKTNDCKEKIPKNQETGNSFVSIKNN